MTQLPTPIAEAVAPLFALHPPEAAMGELVVSGAPAHRLVQAVGEVLAQPALQGRDALAAGLWLYIDDLDRSHRISQSMPDTTGSWWHGIMHRREGDFSNSQYWFRKVGRHPAMETLPGYDAHAFVDQVSARHQDNPEDLVATQHAEWQALFTWCARQDA